MTLVFLDVMPTRLDGPEVSRTLRNETSAPVLAAMAGVEEIDRVFSSAGDMHSPGPADVSQSCGRAAYCLRRCLDNTDTDGAYHVELWSSARPKTFSTLCLLPLESVSVPEYRP